MTQIKFDSFWSRMFYLPSQIKRFLGDFKICNSKTLQNAAETLEAQLIKISRYSYLVDSYIAFTLFWWKYYSAKATNAFFPVILKVTISGITKRKFCTGFIGECF